MPNSLGFLLPSVESDLAGVSQSYLHPGENFVGKLLGTPMEILGRWKLQKNQG